MSCTDNKDAQAANVLKLMEHYDNTQDNSLVIVYDNVVFDDALQADWGFGAVIRVSNHTILYDTGTKADILLNNLKILHIDPSDIDTVFISHTHVDHFGGLEKFLDRNPDVTLYIPANGFGRHRIKKIMSENGKGRYVEVKDPVQLFDTVYSTGQLKGVRGHPTFEQSMIVDTDNGGIVIAGCSHPDIVAIVKKAREVIQKDVFFVLGGVSSFGRGACCCGTDHRGIKGHGCYSYRAQSLHRCNPDKDLQRQIRRTVYCIQYGESHWFLVMRKLKNCGLRELRKFLAFTLSTEIRVIRS